MFSVHFFNLIFSLSAPSNVDVVEILPTAVTVTATPPSGNPDIGVFEASMVGGTPDQKCKVEATVDPLQCEIPNLSPNSEYTVSMRACMSDSDGCGDAITKDTRTLPSRMWIGSNKHITIRLTLWALFYSN